jgi:hypothetical protein
MKLERYADNPILSPHLAHPWEDLAVFNPAAWYDAEQRQVLILKVTWYDHLGPGEIYLEEP